MSEQTRVLGPMGDDVVFENDRVRIWELNLPPGADSNVHQHELDYILVILGGDRVAAVQEPDSTSALPPYFESAVTAGQAVYVEPAASRSPATWVPSRTTSSSSS